ncbi:hook-length control protein FliK [Lutimaribacter pacificus]|uniref:Hook-length control protein FliK n=1 Tax=Lutimaribacter pacificus TaxID=391948 RepID=A0A1H0EB86_9RHOB|nr:flagellar hook-length control protein FliK [Lutimaribacter pacificus]SDN79727.1 hook-length control protein FliK [Lutimaribacter pacificus]SHK54578.1 hook-length control protein FliK [Lutimaribacter pacificus]
MINDSPPPGGLPAIAFATPVPGSGHSPASGFLCEFLAQPVEEQAVSPVEGMSQQGNDHEHAPVTDVDGGADENDPNAVTGETDDRAGVEGYSDPSCPGLSYGSMPPVRPETLVRGHRQSALPATGTVNSAEEFCDSDAPRNEGRSATPVGTDTHESQDGTPVAENPRPRSGAPVQRMDRPDTSPLPLHTKTAADPADIRRESPAVPAEPSAGISETPLRSMTDQDLATPAGTGRTIEQGAMRTAHQNNPFHRLPGNASAGQEVVRFRRQGEEPDPHALGLDPLTNRVLQPSAAPASGAGARPATLAQTVAHQIADAAPRLSEGALEIILRPEELGRLRLTLSPGEGTAGVLTVIADRPETLELVRRHLALLVSEFAAQGFADLHVALGNDRGAAMQGQGGSAAQADDQATPDVTVDIPVPLGRPRMAADTLDIRL